ncbi:MAG: DUF1566 domain-containing protein, partial [Polyangia bacterium]
GSPEGMSWQDALAYCEGLTWGGESDWRLPNSEELQSIASYRCEAPAIDSSAFPGTPGWHFWSSSSSMEPAAIAWDLSFERGEVMDDYGKTVGLHVRCVRDGI